MRQCTSRRKDPVEPLDYRDLTLLLLSDRPRDIFPDPLDYKREIFRENVKHRGSSFNNLDKASFPPRSFRLQSASKKTRTAKNISLSQSKESPIVELNFQLGDSQIDALGIIRARSLKAPYFKPISDWIQKKEKEGYTIIYEENLFEFLNKYSCERQKHSKRLNFDDWIIDHELELKKPHPYSYTRGFLKGFLVGSAIPPYFFLASTILAGSINLVSNIFNASNQSLIKPEFISTIAGASFLAIMTPLMALGLDIRIGKVTWLKNIFNKALSRKIEEKELTQKLNKKKQRDSGIKETSLSANELRSAFMLSLVDQLSKAKPGKYALVTSASHTIEIEELLGSLDKIPEIALNAAKKRHSEISKGIKRIHDKDKVRFKLDTLNVLKLKAGILGAATTITSLVYLLQKLQ